MGRSKSSHRWLQEHERDHYVQKARAEGYRSRASYKLLELAQRDRLLKPGMLVVDLGAAPGGWTQVAADAVGHNGRVIASDILPMDAVAGVDFVLGDFTEQSVFDEILTLIDKTPVDLVISDMAPNMSGMKAIDQPTAMYLVELAFDMATQILKSDGCFVAKLFHGEGFDSFLALVRTHFKSVSARKPDASRSRSSEVYMVAKGYKAGTN